MLWTGGAQCGRRFKINWTKTAHNIQACTLFCGYGLSSGPIKTSARGGRVISHPLTADHYNNNIDNVPYYYYRLLRQHKKHKTYTQTEYTYSRQTNIKIISHHKSSGKILEYPTAYFIASVPSYAQIPCFERSSLYMFLFRYAKVVSTILSD